ncbi:LOW QUALITY PROTEIN: hypothetical protein PHMEG_00024301 [Phytophthora megakarya]|uniref:RNA-directed DNA polymerase n=1 Tax=Phytophthora megakarya TaxID=4795 RepID=A0A225VF04_9STRA|nr:LOW QUALITY PROTEIN: hypothetical protein PHMEG_00024301 [Phytophthora megakarya]
MPGYTVDSDDDVEMSLPQPIFEVIRAPELHNWDHAVLIEWLREWERYVEKMRRRCTTAGETLSESQNAKNLATYVLKKQVADVTDTDIMRAVQARCRTLKNGFVPDVTSLFRQNLRMDPSIDDCDARIFRYYEGFNENTDDTDDKSRMKARCRLLVENLHPPILKEQITRLIDLERRDCKSNDVALFDLILEHTKVQQRFHRISQYYATKGDSKWAKTERKLQKTSSANAGSKTGSARPTLSVTPTSAPVRAPRLPRPPPQDECLVCKGEHWLKDCPTATDDQKETARQQCQAEKEQRARVLCSKAVRTYSTRSVVRVNGLLEVAYIADTGADQSVVSSVMIDSLRGVQPDLITVSLSPPISVTLADGRPQMCGMEVVLDFELVTIAGPVSLRSVPCLILEGDGDEFLLGKDALKRLGIDVDQALAQLADSTLLADEDDEFPVGDELLNQDLAPIATVEELLSRAVANGLPQEHVKTMRELLELFPDIWRQVVGAGVAASVDLLHVTLRVDAKSYRIPLAICRVAGGERARLKNNNAARWACAVVPVRKPGSRDKFRLTIDYRPINRQTISIAGVMPSAATITEMLVGTTVFARFDLTQGFWQLPWHPDSQELFSFVTPDGVYTPKRVPQGALDSALHFQAQMQTILAPLIPHSALVWVNDVILFAPTLDEFLGVLKEFFAIVAKANLILNIQMNYLFELEILWCGRLFLANGVHHDPRRIEALPLPVTVADLQRFVFATNWLYDSLPDYTIIIAPLHDKLEAEKKRIGRRNHNALQVSITWTHAKQVVYDQYCGDAGNNVAAKYPCEKQNHQLVIYKGGMFKHSQLNWTAVEKEAFPIFKTCNDLEYLLLRPRGFRLFCDHANLIYIFGPQDELKKHGPAAMLAMRLWGLHYRIEHISGDTNVWADIISQWHTRQPNEIWVAAVRTRGRHTVPVQDLSALRPMMDANFVFPTVEDIAEAQ